MPAPNLAIIGGLLHDPGYVGGLVDMNVYTSESKQNDQALGINFGNAVARSTLDSTCKAPVVDDDVLLGFALRLGYLHAVAAPGLSQFFNTYDSVPVLYSGFMWGLPNENVSRGDGVVSITALNGVLGSANNTAAGTGTKASGTITFNGPGTAGSTVTINGYVFTAVAAGTTPAAGQYVLGATPAASAANLQSTAAKTNDPKLVVASYTVSGSTITATAAQGGTAGNSYTLATNDSTVAVSGATFTGGSALVTGAGTGRILCGNSTWETTTAANQIGIVRAKF